MQPASIEEQEQLFVLCSKPLATAVSSLVEHKPSGAKQGGVMDVSGVLRLTEPLPLECLVELFPSNSYLETAQLDILMEEAMSELTFLTENLRFTSESLGHEEADSIEAAISPAGMSACWAGSLSNAACTQS